MLLLRTRESNNPAQAEWWEVPGGGIEPGEDSVAAALRELAEETGVVVPRDAVGPVCWTGDVTYRWCGVRWCGVRWWASVVIHLARSGEPEPSRPTALTESERAAFLGHRWLSLAELADEPTFPRGLADNLPRMLAGDRVDAPFHVWN